MEAQRDYKDRMFRLIFKEKKDLLSLYNAVKGFDVCIKSIAESD